MASGVDQLVGWGLFSLAGLAFIYYTLWIIVLPFIHPDAKLHLFFPSWIYAVTFPLVVGVVILIIIGIFVIAITLRSRQKKKKG